MAKLSAPWLKHFGKRAKTLKYPDGSLYDEVLKAAEKYPEYTALDYFGNCINYGTLMAEVDKAARGFISLGAKKGEVISICAPNTPEAIVAIYAANKIGCVANIFHPLSAPNEIRDYVNLGNSKILVAIDIAWDNVKAILPETDIQRVVVISAADSLPILTKFGYHFVNKLLNVKELQKTLTKILVSDKITINWDQLIGRGKYVVGDAYEKMESKDIAVILYSGGTTGTPKGIALSNLAFNSMAVQLKDFFNDILTPGATMLGIMPIFHGFGLGCGFHAMLTNGANTTMFPKFDAKKFDKILENTEPTFVVGVPTLYEAMVKNKKIRKMDLSFIKAAVSGGDTLPAPLKHEVDDLLKRNGSSSKLIAGYGLTECLSVAVVNPLDKQIDGSIGIPLADVYVKIVEPMTYIEKPFGEVGEIVLSGPNLMTGYVNNEKETNETLQIHPDGRTWLHTGDMAYMDANGYIYFAQRLKRMIISSGYNIYPNELEDVINKVDGVLLSTVVGVDDKYRGQIAKAFVVVKEGQKPGQEMRDKIMAACKENLAKYKWPRVIEFRKTMPKTKLGKVAYGELAKGK
jgi:long-chain acyl-CoA synthetase